MCAFVYECYSRVCIYYNFYTESSSYRYYTGNRMLTRRRRHFSALSADQTLMSYHVIDQDAERYNNSARTYQIPGRYYIYALPYCDVG